MTSSYKQSVETGQVPRFANFFMVTIVLFFGFMMSWPWFVQGEMPQATLFRIIGVLCLLCTVSLAIYFSFTTVGYKKWEAAWHSKIDSETQWIRQQWFPVESIRVVEVARNDAVDSNNLDLLEEQYVIIFGAGGKSRAINVAGHLASMLVSYASEVRTIQFPNAEFCRRNGRLSLNHDTGIVLA